MAFVINEDNIMKAISNKDFKTDDQKFNYICAIVDSKISDLKKELKHKKDETKKLDKMKVNTEVFDKVPEYQVKDDKKEDKLKNKFNNMW